MNGWIKIGTKIDSSGVDKGIKALERKIDNAEKDKIIIETNMDKTKVQLDEVNSELDKMKSSADELRSKFAGVKGNLSFEQLLAKKDYEAMIPTIDALDKKQAKISDTLTKQQQKYSKINAQVQTYKEKIDDIELKQQEKLLGKISGSAGKVVKSVVRWSLAAIGVRSIYNGIRSLLSNVSKYNEQVASDMQYMGFALSSIFEPVVKSIVNWLYKILSLVNQISMVFFGKNLFANAGVDKFAKSMGGAAKSAKEINKNLAGFDDLNVLGSEDSGSSGGAGGGSMPSMDLSQMSGEVPQWLLVLKELLPYIIGGILGVVSAITLLKLGLTGIQALGFGVAIAGIVIFVSELIDYLKDPTWENFGGMLLGLGAIVLGFGIAFNALPAIITGAILAIVGILMSNWETITGWFQGIIEWFYGIGDKFAKYVIDNLDVIMSRFGYVGVGIVTIITGAIDTIGNLFGWVVQFILTLFNELFNGIKGIFDGIVSIANVGLKGGLEKVFKSIGNIFINVLNFIIDSFNNFISPIRELIVAVGKVTGQNWTMDNVRIPNVPKLAKGGIISKPTQAIIGEAGKEVVMPLENNTEWIDMLAERLNSMGGNGITVSGKGSWSQFMRFFNFELEKAQKNKGTNFIGGAING